MSWHRADWLNLIVKVIQAIISVITVNQVKVFKNFRKNE